MTVSKVAVGIDLGTSNSCVGVVRNGRVEVIINELGHRVTPSIVAFCDDGCLIGTAAKEQSSDNSKNTVFDAKRLIGRLYDNPHIQTKMKTWPFMVKNIDGNPKIEVEFQGGKKMITPEEISSMVLIRMKEITETIIGTPVTDAVITVPAYFSDSQRQATMDAGAIAGLNVLSIINEPTAAAIAYGGDKKAKETQKILVYDLGGGTFDVAILEISKGKIDVLAVSGNAFLGGGDFDECLMDHCIQKFKKNNKLDISEDPKALHSLRRECEKVKIGLSNPNLLHARVVIYCKGVELVCQISRTCFEHLCSDLFSSTLGPVKTVLQDSKLDVRDIDEVVLVGGSTRILKIRELVEGFFYGKNVNLTINPDEAVAFGAALYAATLVNDPSVDEITLRDVTPLSIGISVLGGKISTIIYRNSKLPTKNTKQYTTTCHNQTAVSIKVYEGEDSLIVNNHLLGEFTLNGIQVALKGVPKIQVTFEVDKNGILSVLAKDTSSDSKETIKITSNKGRLSQKEIDEKVAEAKQLREFESKSKELNEARNKLESFCMEKKRVVEAELLQGRSQERSTEIIKMCDETLLWLEDEKCLTIDVILAKKEELERFCSH